MVSDAETEYTVFTRRKKNEMNGTCAEHLGCPRVPNQSETVAVTTSDGALNCNDSASHDLLLLPRTRTCGQEQLRSAARRPNRAHAPQRAASPEQLFWDDGEPPPGPSNHSGGERGEVRGGVRQSCAGAVIPTVPRTELVLSHGGPCRPIAQRLHSHAGTPGKSQVDRGTRIVGRWPRPARFTWSGAQWRMSRPVRRVLLTFCPGTDLRLLGVVAPIAVSALLRVDWWERQNRALHENVGFRVVASWVHNAH